MKVQEEVLKVHKVERSRLPGYLQQAHPEPGVHCTDHMLKLHLYAEDWQDEIAQVLAAEILPFGPIAFSPAAFGLHHGQVLLEDVWAFQDPRGIPHLLRPQEHIYRLNHGAQQLAMPRIDAAFLLQAIAKLVRLDNAWMDAGSLRALHLRMMLFASEPGIGLHRVPKLFTLLVMATPRQVGALSPVRLCIPRQATPEPGSEPTLEPALEPTLEPTLEPALQPTLEPALEPAPPRPQARSPFPQVHSLAPLRLAMAGGWDDILWLDQAGTHVQQTSHGPIFFRMGDKVLTPTLDDAILPAVSSATVTTLLRDLGIPVVERPVAVAELLTAGANFREAFVTTSAGTLLPVAHIDAGGHPVPVPVAAESLTQTLQTRLQAIHWGTAPDDHRWRYPLPIRQYGDPAGRYPGNPLRHPA